MATRFRISVDQICCWLVTTYRILIRKMEQKQLCGDFCTILCLGFSWQGVAREQPYSKCVKALDIRGVSYHSHCIIAPRLSFYVHWFPCFLHHFFCLSPHAYREVTFRNGDPGIAPDIFSDTYCWCILYIFYTVTIWWFFSNTISWTKSRICRIFSSLRND